MQFVFYLYVADESARITPWISIYVHVSNESIELECEIK